MTPLRVDFALPPDAGPAEHTATRDTAARYYRHAHHLAPGAAIPAGAIGAIGAATVGDTAFIGFEVNR